VCRVVLVVAVVLLGRGPRTDPVGRLCLRRSLQSARSLVCSGSPDVCMPLDSEDCEFNKSLCNLTNSMYSGFQVHHRYIRMGRT
jgi:hypothetical protein